MHLVVKEIKVLIGFHLRRGLGDPQTEQTDPI